MTGTPLAARRSLARDQRPRRRGGLKRRGVRYFRRPKREVTAEDEAAYQEGQRIREGIETLRMGDLEGPAGYTHPGKESRGEF
jgi:hypothetical protein